MSTHKLCFEQKYEFLSENFQFLVVKFSMYLNRHVFIMQINIFSLFFNENICCGISLDLPQ